MLYIRGFRLVSLPRTRKKKEAALRRPAPRRRVMETLMCDRDFPNERRSLLMFYLDSQGKVFLSPDLRPALFHATSLSLSVDENSFQSEHGGVAGS